MSRTRWFWSKHKECEHIQAKHGGESWELVVVSFVHKHTVQVALAVLLVIDVCILIAELILDAEFPPCAVVLEWCAADVGPGAGGSGPSGNCEASCVEHPASLEHVHLALSWASVSILLVFGLELVVLLAATRLSFLRNPFYVLDAAVVGVSLALHFALPDQVARDAGGVLIVVRMWRLVRIGHGIFVDTLEFENEKIEKLKAENRALRDKLAGIGADARAAHGGDYRVGSFPRQSSVGDGFIEGDPS